MFQHSWFYFIIKNRLRHSIFREKLSINLTPSALDNLAKASYDPKYGARPVRRAIQDLVEDPLTIKFLEGEFCEGDTIKIVKKSDKVDLVKDYLNELKDQFQL